MIIYKVEVRSACHCCHDEDLVGYYTTLELADRAVINVKQQKWYTPGRPVEIEEIDVEEE